jgi:deazaflavin-dependent oxidoreductase (nitroreductase family)
MSVVVTPRGSRGVKIPRMPAGIARLVNDLMFRLLKNRRFQNANVLSLTTIGARSGLERRNTIVYFSEPDGSLLVVASAGGTASHPAWFFNLAKNPDKAWVRVGDRRLNVRASTLSGEERDRAWARITTQSPVFAGYEHKTDRQLPIVRLTPTTG